VLLDAVVRLVGTPGGRHLDGTLGGGGHSEALLRAAGPDAHLVGIDRDPHALAAAGARLAPFGDRVTILRGRYADLEQLTTGAFDAILLDLGVSSPQLDRPERGFSFRREGPVDMRMDPDQPLDAAALIDSLDQAGLERILREYGEERRARRVARAVLAGRPWTSTLALADCVARAVGGRPQRIHPATRTFQALRIATNDELGQLDRGLNAALRRLAPGGRLGVISFHSLEDRVVKHRLRQAAGVGAERDLYGQPVAPPLGQLVTRRPLKGGEHDPDNPRARSALLRVFERAAALSSAASPP